MSLSLERVLLGVLVCSLLSFAAGVAAVEVGDPAPDFTLPSTSGKSIGLSQFRGKQSVLLEFYVADAGVT